MSTAYIQSQHCQVFPSAYRGQTTVNSTTKIFNPESRIPSEFNLTTLIRRLTSKDSFVLDIDANNVITFNIYGYWFKLDLSNYISSGKPLSDWDNMWACIVVDARNSSVGDGNVDYPDYALKEFDPASGSTGVLDVEVEAVSRFKGLQLSDTEPTSGVTAKLQLLTKSDDSWVIPSSSKLKFDTSVIADYSSGVTNNSIKDSLHSSTITSSSISSDTMSCSGTITSTNINSKLNNKTYTVTTVII